MKKLSIEDFVGKMYNIPYNKKFEKATESFLLTHGAKIIREPNGGQTFPDFRVTIPLENSIYCFDLEEKTSKESSGKPNYNAHYPNSEDFFIYINSSFSVPFLGKHLPLASSQEKKKIRQFFDDAQVRFDKFADSCKGFLVPRMRVQFTPKRKCPIDYKVIFSDPKVFDDICKHIRQKKID